MKDKLKRLLSHELKTELTKEGLKYEGSIQCEYQKKLHIFKGVLKSEHDFEQLRNWVGKAQQKSQEEYEEWLCTTDFEKWSEMTDF